MIVAHCLVWWSVVCMATIISPSNAKLNSSDTAVKMEMAQYRTKEIARIIEKETTIVRRAFESTWDSRVIKGLLKTASLISQFFDVVDVFSFFVDIIDLFENTQGHILEEIEKLSKSIDFLSDQLDQMQQELKNAFVYNELLSDFNDVTNAVENSDKKLRQVLQYLATVKSERKVWKLAEEYVNRYDGNNIDLHIDNLILMTTQQETETRNNIFDRFIVEKGCDVKKLAIIMLQVKRVVALAARQVMAYHVFKGDGDRGARRSTDMKRAMYKIRRVFQWKVWQCMGYTRELAQADVVKILKSMRNFPDETVVDAVFGELAERYPWYSWAVASIDKHQRRRKEWKGQTYFTAEDGDKRTLLVVYYGEESFASCFDLPKAETLVNFRICADCEWVKYMNASEEKFLTKQKCSYLTPDSTDRFKDFIAAGTQTSVDSCKVGKKCSGNGVCNSVPHSKTILCICNDFVEGESCDITVNPDDSEKIVELIASLREDVNRAFKVPTTVDTYFQILNLSAKIDSLKRDLISVMTNWEVIKDADLVVGFYIKMKKGNVDFDTFGHTIQKHLLTISELKLTTSLYNGILAKGLLGSPGNDFYNIFKKQWFDKNPQSLCTEEYNTAVSRLMRNLATLDQNLGEALIMYREWLRKTQAKTQQERDQFFGEADNLKTEFESRQRHYQDYWTKHSCGDLKLSELSNGKVCKDQLSYEGMTVSVACGHQRVPEYIAYECKNKGNVLNWVPKGKCFYRWGAWGSWSRCSRSCGGGIQMRRRACKGTTNVEDCKKDNNNTPALEQRRCKTIDCCTAKKMFKCPSGKCIPLRYVCDDDNDCGDNADENNLSCPGALRSGDVVALRNHKTGKWFGCWHWQCALTSCNVYGKPWNKCRGEKFRFISLSRREGSILRHGDEVGVQYNLHHDNWLSCWNLECGRSTCPGYSVPTSSCNGERFQIFSSARKGKCKDGEVSCRGDYIRKNDYVSLRYTHKEKWVGPNRHGEILRMSYGHTFGFFGYYYRSLPRWQIVTR